MLEYLIYSSLDFLSKKIQQLEVQPIGSNLRETCFIENPNRDHRQLLAVLDQDVNRIWYAITWSMTLQPFNAKLSTIRVPKTDELVGVVYSGYPVILTFQGSIISNDTLTLVKIYENLYLNSSNEYELQVDIPIQDYSEQVVLNISILPGEQILAYQDTNLPSFEYEMKVITQLLRQEKVGKLIGSIKRDMEVQ